MLTQSGYWFGKKKNYSRKGTKKEGVLKLSNCKPKEIEIHRVIKKKETLKTNKRAAAISQ